MHGEGSAFMLVRYQNEVEWLAERRNGVGGSDVAAIMGLNPWRTAYEVWLEKTGQAVPEDISDKPAVHWGKILEPVIGSEYKRLHPDRKVQRVNAIVRSISRPWAQASLDYEVYDPELGWGVLEIKTAGSRSEGSWDNGIPVYYQTQATHYLSVTGRDYYDLAVLIGGQDYREYRIMRDEGDVDVVERAVDDFWSHNVVAGQEPPFRGGESKAVAELHPKANDEWLNADAEMENLIISYNSSKEMERRYKELADAQGAKLKSMIGDNRGIKSMNGTLTWVRSENTSIDRKGLEDEYPEIAAMFTVKKPKDNGLRWKKS